MGVYEDFHLGCVLGISLAAHTYFKSPPRNSGPIFFMVFFAYFVFKYGGEPMTRYACILLASYCGYMLCMNSEKLLLAARHKCKEYGSSAWQQARESSYMVGILGLPTATQAEKSHEDIAGISEDECEDDRQSSMFKGMSRGNSKEYQANRSLVQGDTYRYRRAATNAS